VDGSQFSCVWLMGSKSEFKPTPKWEVQGRYARFPFVPVSNLRFVLVIPWVRM
jgi:hypothetical protein